MNKIISGMGAALPMPSSESTIIANKTSSNQTNSSAHPSQFNHKIQAGDGQSRKDFINEASRSGSFFKNACKLFFRVATLPITIPIAIVGASIGMLARLIGKGFYSLYAKTEKIFSSPSAQFSKIIQNPVGTLASNKEVMKKLCDQASSSGKTLTESDIKKYVAYGERIANILQDPESKGTGTYEDPLSFKLNGQNFNIKSNTVTTRALSWYMAANAVQQNIIDRGNNKDSNDNENLAIDSECIIPDPDNRIYHFLNAAPTSSVRLTSAPKQIGTQSSDTLINGLLPRPSRYQRGIVDSQNSFPGKGGVIIFDTNTLTSKQTILSIKFEKLGSPAVFSNENNQNKIMVFTRVFAPLDRQPPDTSYSVSKKTKSNLPPSTQDQSKLKKNFNGIMDIAIRKNIIEPDAKALMLSAEKFGFPYMREAATTLMNLTAPGAAELIPGHRNVQVTLSSAVLKGLKNSNIYDVIAPFRQLVDEAIRTKVITEDDKSIFHSNEKAGFSYMWQIVDRILMANYRSSPESSHSLITKSGQELLRTLNNRQVSVLELTEKFVKLIDEAIELKIMTGTKESIMKPLEQFLSYYMETATKTIMEKAAPGAGSKSSDDRMVHSLARIFLHDLDLEIELLDKRNNN